jgi:hypothetical protein
MAASLASSSRFPELARTQRAIDLNPLVPVSAKFTISGNGL